MKDSIYEFQGDKHSVHNVLANFFNMNLFSCEAHKDCCQVLLVGAMTGREAELGSGLGPCVPSAGCWVLWHHPQLC